MSFIRLAARSCAFPTSAASTTASRGMLPLTLPSAVLTRVASSFLSRCVAPRQSATECGRTATPDQCSRTSNSFPQREYVALAQVNASINAGRYFSTSRSLKEKESSAGGRRVEKNWPSSLAELKEQYRGLAIPSAGMMGVVVLSNWLVQFPVNDWLTYGTLSYPVAFLITNLTNRLYGSSRARLVVYAGFLVALPMSALTATPRIALASGAAFLSSQLIDVAIFNSLRHRAWFVAPMVSNNVAAVVDTVVFYGIAFAGTDLPYVTWGMGDIGVKAGVVLASLIPFRALSLRLGQRSAKPKQVAK
mmetsp:Transcript_38092/g.64038  ORF Transcript_38092/g.64038 Transcript_38092/m.64038 type:complete len:305 (+) Transcript_38092:479-1393(+)